MSALGFAAAAAAYRAVDLLRPASTPEPTGGAGFGAALGRAMQQAVDVGRSADVAATRALSGEGSVTDVVLAVSRAELTLQTAVAVRDRVVAAYQEIARMPI